VQLKSPVNNNTKKEFGQELGVTISSSLTGDDMDSSSTSSDSKRVSESVGTSSSLLDDVLGSLPHLDFGATATTSTDSSVDGPPNLPLPDLLPQQKAIHIYFTVT